MAATAEPRRPGPVHPLLAFLLAAGVPLFLGGLLSDIAYANTAEPQWANFAAWLIVGAMMFTGLALLWTIVTLLVARFRQRSTLLWFGLLLATFALGLLDSLEHAKDAWAIMPNAPIYSAIVTILAAISCAVGLATLRTRNAQ